ncbi:uracil phosphoribosyltransferase-domain-containing protein [Dendryphion nanum]|uniref:uracil phosphoribosyltransferase n=1 Tax=Dendryphion nanum TaxID=256645 RepID=A0A9P9D588_9PLEO|nr:uracil phosphoribosyltransferase-domain-containing protein [Dendryphion nanum]
MASSTPPNAHLSQLRSASTGSRDVQALVHELALMIGYEALGSALTTPPLLPLHPLHHHPPIPQISLVPILRSGLSMVSAISSLLPAPTPIHHLGLYREKTTLQPVEYYNNLPYHSSSSSASSPGPATLAIILDPIIATGATACAAIETLREWGVKRILVISVLATNEGLAKACGVWEEGVSVWVGGCDGEVDERGMIKPGLGDVGDRLFGTIGK